MGLGGSMALSWDTLTPSFKLGPNFIASSTVFWLKIVIYVIYDRNHNIFQLKPEDSVVASIAMF